MITCKPDILELQRSKEKDEFIIMGCDGIWEKYVENSQGLIDITKKYIAQKNSDKDILQKLLQQLLAKDSSEGLGCDNMTSILIRFK